MRILMAENHEVFASTVVEEFLADHQVQVERTVRRTLEAFKEDSAFDVAIVDFDLDDGKGTDLVYALHDAGFGGLVVASSAEDEANLLLVAAGADVACGKMEFDKLPGLLHDLFSPVPMEGSRTSRALASLDGLSVGDAFGERFFVPDELAREWVQARRVPASPWTYTDDTEMAIAITELLAHEGHVDASLLARAFARRFAAEPDRGYGAGAVHLLVQIRDGAAWEDASQALFNGQGSMGNGGAMRVAPLGAWYADDLLAVVREARVSARVTHAHLEGQAGAVAVAAAAAYACRVRQGTPSASKVRLLDFAARLCPPGATRDGLVAARRLPKGTSVEEAAAVLGNGSRLLASDTVPFALWCAQRHLDDYRAAVWACVEGLGDRDTTCAMTGGIVACHAPVPDAFLRAREPLRFESDVPGADEGFIRALRDRAQEWVWSLRAPKRSKS